VVVKRYNFKKSKQKIKIYLFFSKAQNYFSFKISKIPKRLKTFDLFTRLPFLILIIRSILSLMYPEAATDRVSMLLLIPKRRCSTIWNRFDRKMESSVVNMMRDELKPVWPEFWNRPLSMWRINFWSYVTAGLDTMA